MALETTQGSLNGLENTYMYKLHSLYSLENLHIL